MQDRYGQVGAVWGVRGELCRTWAQRGCHWLQTAPVAALHSVGRCCWQNPCTGTTQTSSILGHPVTLHTRPTERSQDPAHPSLNPQCPLGPCGTSHPSLQRPWAPLTASSSGSPAMPITCCSWGRVLALLYCCLSPSASSWHHSCCLCTAGARASSSGQAWQADSFPKHLKETGPPLSHARQELSHLPLAGHKVLPGAIPAQPAAPRRVWI